jgi:molybdopterin adenylyltransferase
MKSESMRKHRDDAPKSVKSAVITLSDSKYKDSLKAKNTDLSGNIIINTLNEENEVLFYSVIPDDADLLLDTIKRVIKSFKVDVIITTGGTGIGSRDITIETLKNIFDKELIGFGEIFRYESYKKLGTGAILSRTTAGVYKETLIIALPGSPNAVNLGMKIILKELGHIVKHIKE